MLNYLGAAKSLKVKKIIWSVRNTNYEGRGNFNEFVLLN